MALFQGRRDAAREPGLVYAGTSYLALVGVSSLTLGGALSVISGTPYCSWWMLVGGVIIATFLTYVRSVVLMASAWDAGVIDPRSLDEPEELTLEEHTASVDEQCAAPWDGVVATPSATAEKAGRLARAKLGFDRSTDLHCVATKRLATQQCRAELGDKTLFPNFRESDLDVVLPEAVYVALHATGLDLQLLARECASDTRIREFDLRRERRALDACGFVRTALYLSTLGLIRLPTVVVLPAAKQGFGSA